MDSFNFISDCEGVISDSIYVRFISFVQSIENKDTFVSKKFCVLTDNIALLCECFICMCTITWLLLKVSIMYKKLYFMIYFISRITNFDEHFFKPRNWHLSLCSFDLLLSVVSSEISII